MAERSNRYSDYIDGSAARQLEQPRRQYVEPQRQYEEPKREAQVRPKYKKKVSHVSLIIMMASIGMSLYLCLGYIMLYTDISATSKAIVQLESQIEGLQSSNASAYEEIDSSIDLQEIYRIATEELGMVHATDGQVYTYDNKKSDRVIQYGTIPQ